MKIALPLICLLVAGCRDAQPPLPTRDEAAQLNEAEDLLDQTANDEGPDAAAADPSLNN
ncbi:hypothetical protein H9L13_11785 [Sphingomonas lutea]|uniref:Uncharacterized protein n=1 Tax=Sphingomonas lutea TaxID=1045317 RepID=A0A7G9SHE8_9SPHN|nr:hypothetical protein [Sphingomonas lutea]QNN67273.1 hypothetical protein H9L13_11785 [Sphingomonas lutea]